MKATRWLTDEQIEAIEAAHREEMAAVAAASTRRREAVKAALAMAPKSDLVAKKPHLKNKALFRLSGVEATSFMNQGEVCLVVCFDHVGSAVPLRDILVKAKK